VVQWLRHLHSIVVVVVVDRDDDVTGRCSDVVARRGLVDADRPDLPSSASSQDGRVSDHFRRGATSPRGSQLTTTSHPAAVLFSDGPSPAVTSSVITTVERGYQLAGGAQSAANRRSTSSSVSRVARLAPSRTSKSKSTSTADRLPTLGDHEQAKKGERLSNYSNHRAPPPPATMVVTLNDTDNVSRLIGDRPHSSRVQPTRTATGTPVDPSSIQLPDRLKDSPKHSSKLLDRLRPRSATASRRPRTGGPELPADIIRSTSISSNVTPSTDSRTGPAQVTWRPDMWTGVADRCVNEVAFSHCSDGQSPATNGLIAASSPYNQTLVTRPDIDDTRISYLLYTFTMLYRLKMT